MKKYSAFGPNGQKYFDTIPEACKWAEEHLGEVETYSIRGIEAQLEEDGRAMISQRTDGFYPEEIVIFDTDKHLADTNGRIEW